MNKAIAKCLANNVNDKVLSFLQISKYDASKFISFEEKSFYTHEVLEEFLKLDLPSITKFIYNGCGLIIIPETGEIIAIQFYQSEVAIKLLHPKKMQHTYSHIKRCLLLKFKFFAASKVSLRYFSNCWNHKNSIIDIRKLDKNWGLSIYFLDQKEYLIQETYNERMSKL